MRRIIATTLLAAAAVLGTTVITAGPALADGSSTNGIIGCCKG